ncbi:MAG: hypothetical protein OXI76_12430 [Gemmatimonadota bacterium]|nr:hypothetical protein [Gemmatimonadota bacterium]
MERGRTRRPGGRMRRGTFTWLLTVSPCLAAGCGDGHSEDAPEARAEAADPVPVAVDLAAQPLVTDIRDSAGIRIIENGRPPDESRLPWRIGAEPSVSIGEVDGREPYVLHKADDALMLPDRRVVIANTGTNEIRLYDAGGTHQTTWGGTGQGPGEFQELAGVARWPGDSILAWEAMRSSRATGSLWRGAVFDAGGEPGRSFRIQSDDGAGLEPRLVLAEGGILGRMTSGGADDGYWRYEATYSLLAREGAAEVPFGTHPAHEGFSGVYNGVVLHVPHMAFSRGLEEAAWEGMLVIASNDRYELRAYRMTDGALAKIVRREHANRAPTRAEIVEAMHRTFIEGEQPEEVIEMFRPAFDEAPIVEGLPSFRSVLADPLGHLWVQEYTPPDMDRPAPLWTVFDPGGRALGFVETPAGLSVFEIGADYLLGRAANELGIERIEVWALERGGA